MQIDGFIDRDSFKRQMTNSVFRRTQTFTWHQRALLPGDPEREAEALRPQKWVPLVLPVVEELRDIRPENPHPLSNRRIGRLVNSRDSNRLAANRRIQQ